MEEHRAMAVLHALQEVESALERYRESRQRREYVRAEHRPFLDTRFRTFDQYIAVNNPRNFAHYARVTLPEYERLYERLAPTLLHPMTHASPISGRHRLFIFLRFVGNSSGFGSLGEELLCGKSTISQIVYEVARAMRAAFFDEAFPGFTREHLEETAVKTQQRFGYPHAVGFMDGKHIQIKKPANSGSMYFNYKRTFSIILLALVDCDYRILAFTLGAPGRMGDAGVFMNSTIKHFFDLNNNIFPPARALGNVGPVQYHILVDCGFAQDYRYIRPYPQATADTASKRRFNWMHSSARHTVESFFGILCQHCPILLTPMQLDPDNAIDVVTALLVLHNFLGRRDHSLEGVVRFPPPPSQLDPLQEPDDREDAVAVSARERIRAYFDNIYGPLI